jgi:hypothetical protein
VSYTIGIPAAPTLSSVRVELVALMTRREIAFLLIGLGLGLLLSVAVVLEVLISLQRGSIITGYGIDKIAVLIPILFLVSGIILLGYRKRAHQEPS